MPPQGRPVVHLELHTWDLHGAREFYAHVCDWHPEAIPVPTGSYLSLELGRQLGGGMVECSARRPVWLPYVEVADVGEATERARRLGARVMLEPREGPAGWRSVLAAPAAGELAFWQPARASFRA